MLEFAIIAPLMMLMVVSLVDTGRLIFWTQIVGQLAREAAREAAQGVDAGSVIATTNTNSAPLELASKGRIIISTIQAKEEKEGPPWVIKQVAGGGLSGFQSKVGKAGGPATLAGFEELEDGLTLYAAEVAYPFQPMFSTTAFGTRFYPSLIYRAAFF